MIYALFYNCLNLLREITLSRHYKVVYRTDIQFKTKDT
jgi:hypothetical protein